MTKKEEWLNRGHSVIYPQKCEKWNAIVKEFVDSNKNGSYENKIEYSLDIMENLVEELDLNEVCKNSAYFDLEPMSNMWKWVVLIVTECSKRGIEFFNFIKENEPSAKQFCENEEVKKLISKYEEEHKLMDEENCEYE